MTFDTLITGGQVVTETGSRPLTVALNGGTIAALLAPETPAEAHEIIRENAMIFCRK